MHNKLSVQIIVRKFNEKFYIRWPFEAMPSYFCNSSICKIKIYGCFFPPRRFMVSKKIEKLIKPRKSEKKITEKTKKKKKPIKFLKKPTGLVSVL